MYTQDTHCARICERRGETNNRAFREEEYLNITHHALSQAINCRPAFLMFPKYLTVVREKKQFRTRETAGNKDNLKYDTNARLFVRWVLLTGIATKERLRTLLSRSWHVSFPFINQMMSECRRPRCWKDM